MLFLGKYHNRHKYSVRDVVGDVSKDVFCCVHALQYLILTQDIINGLPFW